MNNNLLLKEKWETEQQEQVKEFITQHGLGQESDYHNFYMSLGFYYLYMIQCIECANQVQDGEIFDIYEVTVAMSELKKAYQVVEHYKARVCPKLYTFSPSETVYFEHSSLQKGEIIGDKEQLLQISRRWIRNFLNRSERNLYANYLAKVECDDESILHDLFLFQVGTFILYKEGHIVEYSFLQRAR